MENQEIGDEMVWQHTCRKTVGVILGLKVAVGSAEIQSPTSED
jgi:hypothetical protein